MRQWRANARLAWVIFTKELLDTLRDRRTLFMMVGLPVLLYPALVLASLQLAVMQHEQLERKITRVVVDSPWPELRLWLQEREKLKLVESEHPQQDLDEGLVEVVVHTPEFDLSTQTEHRSTSIHLLYDATNFESLDGALRVEAILDEMRERLLEERLAKAGIDEQYIEPLAVEQVNVAPPEKTTGNILGMILPMMMVMMIALGAFYPAVDLTAGEKERGTFETLLSTPATKFSILLGKFSAVALLALATGLLNLGSMAATFAAMLRQVSPLFEGDLALTMRLPLSSVLWVVLVLVPFAGLISAVMMSIAVYARSFKEAQNYVTPFMLVIMAPALVALLPGVQLNAGTAIVPVLNVVLLFRALMTDAASLPLVLMVLGLTTVYAGLALAFASWLFHREDVVLADQNEPVFIPRRGAAWRDAPTPFSVLALYGGLVVMLFFGGTFLQHLDPISGVLILQYGLLLLPALAFLYIGRIDMRRALSLHMPPPLAWLGALMLSLGALVLLVQVGVYQQRILPVPAGLEEQFKIIFDSAKDWGVWGIVFAIAITPAICEEVIFRGVVLSGLRRHMPMLAVVILVGIMFGVFHLSVYRVIPTTLLGILLTYVCLRTHSIFPSIVMHAINNGIVILFGTNALPPRILEILAPEKIQAHGVPAPLLLLAAGCLLVGFALIERSTHTSPRKQWRVAKWLARFGVGMPPATRGDGF